MECLQCKGPYSEATGHAFTETAVLCGRCAREFYGWYKQRMLSMNRVKPPSEKSWNEVAVQKRAEDGGVVVSEETRALVEKIRNAYARTKETTHGPYGKALEDTEYFDAFIMRRIVRMWRPPNEKKTTQKDA